MPRSQPKEPALKRPRLHDGPLVPLEIPSLRRSSRHVPSQKPNRNLEPINAPSPDASVASSSPVVHHPKLILRLPSNRNTNDAGRQGPPPSSSSECKNGEQQTRPWNLRPRKVANYKHMADASAPSPVHVRNQPQPDNAVRTTKKRKRAMLTVSLTKSEIDEDFCLMTGSMPPQQPKWRPQKIQQMLDKLFPGLCLPETVKPCDYKDRRYH